MNVKDDICVNVSCQPDLCEYRKAERERSALGNEVNIQSMLMLRQEEFRTMSISSESGFITRRSALRGLGLAGAGLGVLVSCDVRGESAGGRFHGAGKGIRSDGKGDDAQPLQAAIDAIAARGGGELVLARNALTRATAGPIVRDNVTLDLNGGTLVLHLSAGDAVGVRLRSGASLRNGRVIVRSSGMAGTQAGVHAPVVVGPLYGAASSAADPHPDEGISGWSIRNVSLSSDKDVDLGGGNRVGAAGIQIIGGAHTGLIENVRIPDSPLMAGGIHLDWGAVGPISSQTIARNAELYRAGRGFTTHPHHITIRNIRIGRLTRPRGAAGGTTGVRLSGVYAASVSDVEIELITEAAFRHTAGDLGFEFAPAEVRPERCRGIRFVNGTVADASTGHVIHSDSYADNIGRAVAQGYRAILDPIYETDILFQNISGSAHDLARANFGVRIDHQRGGRIVDCRTRGFRQGMVIDEQVEDLTLVRPIAIDNAEHGISVDHPRRPPRNIVIDAPIARGNGRDPRGVLASGVLVGESENVRVTGGDAPIDTRQRRGIRIDRLARHASASGSPAAQVTTD